MPDLSVAETCPRKAVPSKPREEIVPIADTLKVAASEDLAERLPLSIKDETYPRFALPATRIAETRCLAASVFRGRTTIPYSEVATPASAEVTTAIASLAVWSPIIIT